MLPIDSIRARLKKEEGYSNVPYKDTKGILSIGYGWNMDANPLPKDIKEYLDHNGFISRSDAERLLTFSILMAIDSCKGLWSDFESFPLNAQEALIDVVFNMGATKIKSKFPRFCVAVDDQKWEIAANELKYADGKARLSKWYNDVKETRAEGIIGLLREAAA